MQIETKNIEARIQLNYIFRISSSNFQRIFKKKRAKYSLSETK